jgi:hypothetical protein
VTAQARGVANGHRGRRLFAERDQTAAFLAAGLHVLLGRTVAGLTSELLTLIARVLEEELPFCGGGKLRHLLPVTLDALGGTGVSGRRFSCRRLLYRWPLAAGYARTKRKHNHQ